MKLYWIGERIVIVRVCTVTAFCFLVIILYTRVTETVNHSRVKRNSDFNNCEKHDVEWSGRNCIFVLRKHNTVVWHILFNKFSCRRHRYHTVYATNPFPMSHAVLCFRYVCMNICRESYYRLTEFDWSNNFINLRSVYAVCIDYTITRISIINYASSCGGCIEPDILSSTLSP